MSQPISHCENPPGAGGAGGEGGIRTHGTVSRSGAFKAPALVHYATSPGTDSYARERGEHPVLADPYVRYGTLWRVKAIVPANLGPRRCWSSARSTPPSPGPNEVLIKVAAAGVNRADLLQRQGHYRPLRGVSPLIGLEVSGTIAAAARRYHWAVEDTCVALLGRWRLCGVRGRARRAGRTAAARGGARGGSGCHRGRGDRCLLQRRNDRSCRR